MAITVLGRDESPQGTWQIDYDSTGHNVGHTVTTNDPAARLVLTITRVSDLTQKSEDVSADFGQGRVVDITGVQPSEVPAHVKGTVYPFLFSGVWVA